MYLLFLTTKIIYVFHFFHTGAPQHCKLAGSPLAQCDIKMIRPSRFKQLFGLLTQHHLSVVLIRLNTLPAALWEQDIIIYIALFYCDISCITELLWYIVIVGRVLWVHLWFPPLMCAPSTYFGTCLSHFVKWAEGEMSKGDWKIRWGNK